MDFILTTLSVLLTARQVTAACDLCFEGEAITKPDQVLDLTNPVPIKTCQDLIGLLVFIPEDDEICSTAQGVGTLCGCPNRPPYSCTICGDNMSRPLQNLDGLIDLGSVDFFGLAPTCALIESILNTVPKQEQEACMHLPMKELQQYCGCPSEENEPRSCTLCPGGEVVPVLPEHNFVEIRLGSTGNQISCSEAHAQVKEEESESELCNDIQSGSTACGCPVPENACELCPEGMTLNLQSASSEQVDTIFGTRQDCGTFASELHRYDRNSTECQSLEKGHWETCGCEKDAEFVPCALCPGREAVAYPDKELTGLKGKGFDYIEPTCGTIDRAVVLLDEKDILCRSAQTNAKLCGCTSIPETSCSLCELGDTPANPYGQYQWVFGSLSETLQTDIEVSEGTYSCEAGDSFLSAIYDRDDEFCYFNQLVRGSACGCSHGGLHKKVVALEWTQRCSGILSLIGSLAIILLVLTKKAKDRWNTYNQIVLCISVFDALSSVAYIFGTALTPTEIGIHGSIGNEGTCVFQGWLFQIIQESETMGVLIVGIAMSLAVIPFVTADWRWCCLSKPPYAESWLPGIFFFILPIGICMIVMTVLMAFFVIYVRQVEKKSDKRKLAGNGPNRSSLTNRTFRQSFYFLAVFYITWPIQFLAFTIPLVESNYWVYLLAAVLGPLQGFLNALVVFYRDRKALSKGFLRLLGIEYVMERCSVMFTTIFRAKSSDESKLPTEENTSPIVNADPEGLAEEHCMSPEKENLKAEPDMSLMVPSAKKNIDSETDSGILSQDIDQSASPGGADIDTSISIRAAFSDDNVEGHLQSNRKRESIALLEFAMNAGLLTDDDYALYQDSINHIEESSNRC